MRWTGRISYSLYLWHWRLLILIPDAVGHPLTLLQRCAAISAAVLLSVVTYVFVEQPFQHQRILVTNRSAVSRCPPDLSPSRWPQHSSSRQYSPFPLA